MMPSYLTRRVFRRLLSSQPFIQHRHIHPPQRLQPSAHHVRVSLTPPTRRTFFGFFDKPKEETQLDPGMEKMLELDKRIHLIARLPPQATLARAFVDFLTDKTKRARPVEDFHATLLLQTLQTIEQQIEDGEEPILNRDDLRMAMKTICRGNVDFAPVHQQLARLIFQAFQRTEGASELDHKGSLETLARYVDVLCRSGDSSVARNILVAQQVTDTPPWSYVLEGFSREGNERELLTTLDMMEAKSVPFDMKVYGAMTMYYTRMDNIEKTKEWCKSTMFNPKNPELRTGRVYQAVLEFCLRNSEMEWGLSVLQEADVEDVGQHTMLAMLRAAANTGKSVDEIDRMIDVLVRRSGEHATPDRKPRAKIFHSLVKVALSKNDQYTAERYFSLMSKWGATPSATTYILQVEHRLAAKDIKGALAAYTKLREEKDSEDKDWPIMNRLIRELIVTPDVQHEAVLGLISDLLERRQTFPAETVLALCAYHLDRDEYADLADRDTLPINS